MYYHAQWDFDFCLSKMESFGGFKQVTWSKVNFQASLWWQV
jgi:hypothetical protein